MEGCSPEALTLISLQGALLPEAVEAHDGYLSVRGKLVFTLLLKKAEETPFVKLCTLPFEEEITAEDARIGDGVSMRAFCGAPAVTLASEGEDTAILFDAEYSLLCVLCRNRPFSYLDDLYAHGARHEILRKPFSAESLVGTATGNFTVGEEVSLPADFKSGGTLLPQFSLKEAEATPLGERVILEGKLGVLLLSFENMRANAALGKIAAVSRRRLPPPRLRNSMVVRQSGRNPAPQGRNTRPRPSHPKRRIPRQTLAIHGWLRYT